jgi:serine protease Do
MSKRAFVIGIFFSSLIAAVVTLGGYHLLVSSKDFKATEQIVASPVKLTSASTEIIVPEGLNFINAAERVTPAVVHVKTFYEAKKSSPPNLQQIHPFFRDFFGDQFDNIPQHRQPQQSAGSGVIISADGYIISNNHVVEGADKVEVILNDKRTYEAKVIGTDPTTDLSLLKIEENGLVFVDYGNSDNIKIGEWVLAVGNPFNLTSTVTAGIVSAKARNIGILREKYGIESFIQTDAAVNPGNSGGALVNLNGELVGINTAIATPTGTFAGYSFAIPVTLVKKVIEDIMKFGEVQRALLGINIRDVDNEIAKDKNLKSMRGIYVADFSDEQSAAKAAGIEKEDIITEIDGIEVSGTSELMEQVARKRPGDKIKVKVLRDGKDKTFDVTLRNKMGNTKVVKKDSQEIIKTLGASFQNLSDSDKKKYDVLEGVKVTEVEKGNFKNAGMKPDFVITYIDKEKVKNTSDLEKIMRSKKGWILVQGVYPDGSEVGYGVQLDK